MSRRRSLLIGSRKSRLAVWQSRRIKALIEDRWPQISCQIVYFDTTGDRLIDRPLPEIGGKGVFTAELEHALHAGEIDLAVHSLKDLPVGDPPGLTLGAITERADVGDVLVAKNKWTLAEIPAAGVIGTSSRRRGLQIRLMRPDLTVASIRGNVETRVDKVLNGSYDAVVLAAAGLERLGLNEVISDRFSVHQMVPAPGQGALAVQCRVNDEEILELLQPIDDEPTRMATTAERTLLSALGGGCSAPVGALGDYVDEDRLRLHAIVGSPQTGEVLRFAGEGYGADEIGRQAAENLLQRGARSFLGE